MPADSRIFAELVTLIRSAEGSESRIPIRCAAAVRRDDLSRPRRPFDHYLTELDAA